MAIPAELQYRDEADLTDNFLVPLLQRLGFSLVVNYHGSAEYGKDLVFADIDRFGHVAYHAMQAKYKPAIGNNDVQGLVNDCLQAFANPFSHPQTGASQSISKFYAVNAGSLWTAPLK